MSPQFSPETRPQPAIRELRALLAFSVRQPAQGLRARVVFVVFGIEATCHGSVPYAIDARLADILRPRTERQHADERIHTLVQVEEIRRIETACDRRGTT